MADTLCDSDGIWRQHVNWYRSF